MSTDTEIGNTVIVHTMIGRSFDLDKIKELVLKHKPSHICFTMEGIVGAVDNLRFIRASGSMTREMHNELKKMEFIDYDQKGLPLLMTGNCIVYDQWELAHDKFVFTEYRST